MKPKVDVSLPSLRVSFTPAFIKAAGESVHRALDRQSKDGKVGRKADGSPATLHRTGDLFSKVDVLPDGSLSFRVDYAAEVFKRFPAAEELLPEYLADVERELDPLAEAGGVTLEER